MMKESNEQDDDLNEWFESFIWTEENAEDP
jgi:hypothetical protein